MKNKRHYFNHALVRKLLTCGREGSEKLVTSFMDDPRGQSLHYCQLHSLAALSHVCILCVVHISPSVEGIPLRCLEINRSLMTRK